MTHGVDRIEQLTGRGEILLSGPGVPPRHRSIVLGAGALAFGGRLSGASQPSLGLLHVSDDPGPALLGVPLEPYQQKNYVTCLDLGPSDAVFTRGWNATVEMSGDKELALQLEEKGYDWVKEEAEEPALT